MLNISNSFSKRNVFKFIWSCACFRSSHLVSFMLTCRFLLMRFRRCMITQLMLRFRLAFYSFTLSLLPFYFATSCIATLKSRMPLSFINIKREIESKWCKVEYIDQLNKFLEKKIYLIFRKKLTSPQLVGWNTT